MNVDTLIVEDILLLMLGDADRAPVTSLDGALGGAVLAELALRGHARVEDRRATSDPLEVIVAASGDGTLLDPLLGVAHEAVTAAPRRLRTALPGLGASLRTPVVERLIERGLLRRERRGFGGLISTTRLPATERHETRLREQLRLVLELGADPAPRLTALIALVSAVGTLPSLHPHPRWTGQVATRARRLGRGGTGDLGVEAAAVVHGVAAALSTATVASPPTSGSGLVALSVLVGTPAATRRACSLADRQESRCAR
ncbi:GPP34 family phosphoprotein [Actinomycetospora sp. OC33-EN08]|uniref:GPP34 family phosphoprotein n=1 Tax=Actinomycetospora aurantiaca TaxID=3129233 RepID=A0ABU8MTE9_9PSEU